jgi:hypothetical protein
MRHFYYGCELTEEGNLSTGRGGPYHKENPGA